MTATRFPILREHSNIGHAIEKCSDTYSHGKAISIGMVAISVLSVTNGWLKPKEYTIKETAPGQMTRILKGLEN
jgi:3-dehydroquinate synthetase